MSDITASNIFERGCLINLSFSVWGGKIKIPASALHVDADSSWLRGLKSLIDEAEKKPIEKIRNAARTYVYAKSLPFPIPGVLFIPRELVPEIDEKLCEFKAAFDARADEFAANFDLYIEQARRALNGLFNYADYPRDIRSHFSFDWQFISIAAPGSQSILSPELLRREQARYEATIREFTRMATESLRTEFAAMVGRVTERLSGEKKIFRDSLVGNIREFIEDFKHLNINDDVALAAQIARVEEILSGVSADSLRTNDHLRNVIQGQMKTVEVALNDMTQDRPTRRLRRTDEQ